MGWLDLLAVQGTLKRLLQQHSSKASILRHSAFFTVQLSHPYMTTGKTIALEKTLEGPLDCKEIQPVHSEGDQPWDFFGGIDTEAETLVLWPPHAKS